MKVFNRVNPRGLAFHIIEGMDGKTRVNLSGTTKFIELNHDVTKIEQSWSAWMFGKMIQNAFDYLSPGEREFFQTGITEDEWNRMFQGRG